MRVYKVEEAVERRGGERMLMVTNSVGGHGSG